MPPTDTPSIQHDYESACNLNLIIPPLLNVYDKDVCRQREEEEEQCFVYRVFRQKSRRLRSVALIHNVMLVNGLLVVASKEIENKKKNKLATKSSVQCSIFVTPRVLWFTKSFGSQ